MAVPAAGDVPLDSTELVLHQFSGTWSLMGAEVAGAGRSTSVVCELNFTNEGGVGRNGSAC